MVESGGDGRGLATLTPMSQSEDDPIPETDEDPIFVVPIEESIDLHGFRPREILDVVDAYLDAALERGFVEVRLIHGRGKGVQRARVHQWLEGDPRVRRVEEAPPRRGGWGATLAWLDPASVPSPDQDPEK
ncbi:MAG: Smr/MutS family protein [Myxococcota bacterium]|nr:Smr/MutS family protein [Myxococcota bacterium]